MSDQPTIPQTPDQPPAPEAQPPQAPTPASVSPPVAAASAAQAPVAATLHAAGDAAPTPASATTAASAPPSGGWIWGTGRRKRAVARVRIRPGAGKFLVDNREAKDYFLSEQTRLDVLAPLRATESIGKFDIIVNIHGGGQQGQAGAIVLGVARALVKADPNLEQALRDGRYLTRDSRKVERKKPGQPGARKRFQFSKR